MIIVQVQGLLKTNLHLRLTSSNGQLLMENDLLQGSTIVYFDTLTLYNGVYFLNVTDGLSTKTFKVAVQH